MPLHLRPTTESSCYPEDAECDDDSDVEVASATLPLCCWAAPPETLGARTLEGCKCMSRDDRCVEHDHAASCSGLSRQKARRRGQHLANSAGEREREAKGGQWLEPVTLFAFWAMQDLSDVLYQEQWQQQVQNSKHSQRKPFHHLGKLGRRSVTQSVRMKSMSPCSCMSVCMHHQDN